MQTDTKPNPLKVTVSNVKNLFGRKSATFEATLGETGWKATGTCKQGALDQLYADLKNASENTYSRRYVRKGSVTFALYFSGGWQYDIIRDNGQFTVCCLLSNSFNDALERMMKHAADHDGQ